MVSVAIIDYGVGNLRSVEKAFAAVGVDAVVTSDKTALTQAERLVLPGVGAFATCMSEFNRYGFAEVVLRRVKERIPLLGVCVGMQMLFEESSEFGSAKGLGLLKGSVKRFSSELTVPHVGWNEVSKRFTSPLLNDVDNNSFFYFVHSYYCDPEDRNTIVGETEYGIRFASVVAKDNVCGVQFHPEKSQASGLRLLKNFAKSDVR
ncbi:MAG TPA: imidazole glycerol phosphate synthase subunit HisH [Pyrinomonadaceae bacterium]|nr:imidazole glycerol phosphate synthase subunit HisH [Pyrinomonadaceae bacterium]